MTRPRPDRTLFAFLVSGLECSLAWCQNAPGLLEVKRSASFLAPIRRLELGEQQIHLIPTDESRHWPRRFAIHVDEVRVARGRACPSAGAPVGIACDVSLTRAASTPVAGNSRKRRAGVRAIACNFEATFSRGQRLKELA